MARIREPLAKLIASTDDAAPTALLDVDPFTGTTSASLSRGAVRVAGFLISNVLAHQAVVTNDVQVWVGVKRAGADAWDGPLFTLHLNPGECVVVPLRLKLDDYDTLECYASAANRAVVTLDTEDV